MAKEKYFVVYKTTMTGQLEHRAGPYNCGSEVEQHRSDIAGYEGTYDIHLEECTSPAHEILPSGHCSACACQR